ncbi:MAG: hypothetical protein FXF49_09230 [Flexistipes sinusarabici]|uniref:Rhodanese domain-containing protein n=1 Tax=Flexistipes sinusarabici TaxID=2352 RepID=A0A5D0MN15_FLESI|nr:hypothetical protein [Flexistipes sinusarabici]TYB32871.1 MAG: hypothetical protein FXF49_09230 [Flexistipes sinusarabici]
MSKFCFKKYLLLFVAALFFASTFATVSCATVSNGTGVKSNYKNSQLNMSEYEGTLISADKLKSWLDNGMRTEDGKPVVVIERTSGVSGVDYDSDGKPDYIPGSVISPFGSLQEVRSDGPVNNVSMILSGPTMNRRLQEYGITKDTVVVFTGVPGYIITRGWWTFYYWGFSEENIKVLDGGTKAYFDAGYYTTNEPKIVKSSSFKISDLPDKSIRVERIDNVNIV